MAEPGITVGEHVPLSGRCSLGVGGAARWFTTASSPAHVAAADAWCAARGARLFVLGGGTNIVVSDAGIDGLVVAMAMRGVERAGGVDDLRVTAAAGEPWDQLVGSCVARGFAGLECLSGIPGLVGGTPIQNVGAYGQEMADAVTHVSVYDRHARDFSELSARDCGFAYRTSRFKGVDAGRFVVCGVSFTLERRAPTVTYPDVAAHLERTGCRRPRVDDVRDAVLAIRRRKGMVVDPADPDTRSVGSFFTNPVLEPAELDRVSSAAGESAPAFAQANGRSKVPAAWLIERAGFRKGHVEGAAGISSKHPLALVNRGGATAGDILRLAAAVKRRVVDRFGVWLVPEPLFIGFDDDPGVAFLLKAND